MYGVEIYYKVRRAHYVDGVSIHELSRVFGIHRDTVRKMLSHSVPPGYQRRQPAARAKLDPFTGIIEEDCKDLRARFRRTASRGPCVDDADLALLRPALTVPKELRKLLAGDTIGDHIAVKIILTSARLADSGDGGGVRQQAGEFTKHRD